MKNNSKRKVFHFLKFGEEENVIDLYENGTIYCNSIDYFQKLEEQGLRGDQYEGTTKITNYHQYDQLKVTLRIPGSDEELEINPEQFHLREFLNDVQGNIYSMYAIKTPEVSPTSNEKIDPRVASFGPYFLKINDVKLFIDRVANELKRRQVGFETGFVEYYDRHKVNQEIGILRKPLEFEYQKEFRFVIYRQGSDPFIFHIGSLKDIAEVHETEAIKSWVLRNGTRQ